MSSLLPDDDTALVTNGNRPQNGLSLPNAGADRAFLSDGTAEILPSGLKGTSGANTVSGDDVQLLRGLLEDGAAGSAGKSRASLGTITGFGLDEAQEYSLGDATAFTGVAKYPARIKCALLGWAALKDALAKSGAALPADTSTRPMSSPTSRPMSSPMSKEHA